jgi:hypothetical protein
MTIVSRLRVLCVTIALTAVSSQSVAGGSKPEPSVIVSVECTVVRVQGADFNSLKDFFPLRARIAPGVPDKSECYGVPSAPFSPDRKGGFRMTLHLPDGCRWRCDGRPDAYVVIVETASGSDFIVQVESAPFGC